MTGRRSLPLFFGTLLLVGLFLAPAAALGQEPIVSLSGAVAVDPNAATLRIVPPQGGAVMVYRNGVSHGWFMSTGYSTVEPGVVYGVLATRGKSTLFHGGVLMRRGLTDIAWIGDNDGTPAMSYTPPPDPDLYLGGSHHHHHHVKPVLDTPDVDPTISRSRYRTLIRKMRAEESQRARLVVLQQYTRRYRFTQAQADAAVAEFSSKTYRRRAANSFGGRVVDRHGDS